MLVGPMKGEEKTYVQDSTTFAIAVMVLHDAFDEAVRDLKAHYPEACKILSIANIHGNRPWGGGGEIAGGLLV